MRKWQYILALLALQRFRWRKALHKGIWSRLVQEEEGGGEEEVKNKKKKAIHICNKQVQALPPSHINFHFLVHTRHGTCIVSGIVLKVRKQGGNAWIFAYTINYVMKPYIVIYQ